MNDLPVILQDTREPNEEIDHPSALFSPWIWRGKAKVGLPVRRVKLDEGDYTAEGLERHVIVERKTLVDLLGTLFGETSNALGEAEKNLDRFHDELQRMRPYHLKCIVVEANVEGLERIRTQRNHWGREMRQFNPMAARALLTSFLVTYGVPTIWAGSREQAEHFVGSMLHYAWLQSRGGEAAEKARRRGSVAPWLPAVAP